MRNGKGGNEDRPSSEYAKEKEKRSFWSRFFEPVPEDADSPAFREEDYGAYPDEAYDEDAARYLPEEDEDDEETVLLGGYGEEKESAAPIAALPPAAEPSYSAPAEPAAPVFAPVASDTAAAPAGEFVSTGRDMPYTQVPPFMGGPAASDFPQGQASPGYVPLTSRLEKQPVPPVEAGTPFIPEGALFDPYTGMPIASAAAYAAPEEYPQQAYAPGGESHAPVFGEAGEESEPEAPSSYAASFLTGAAAGAGIEDFTEAERMEAQRPRKPQRPVRLFEDEDDAGNTGTPESIRLFDDEGDTTARRPMGETTRTHMFRTGTTSTTRIHLNETEELLRAEESEQRIREREARARREARREKENKRKQRRKVLKKIFGNIAFILFFLAAVIVALYYGFLLSEVTVLGNDKYETDYIVQLSGLEKGTHMLFCDLDGAKTNIQTDPYIQVDQINYLFPNRIRIVVTERKEVAGIIGLDYNVIIDDQGYVLSMSGGTDLAGLLQVTGVSMTGFQLGQRLGEGNDFTTATLVDLIDKLEQYNLLASVTSVDLTTPLAITMTAKNGLSIHLGQGTDLDMKMQMLYRLLPNFLTKHDISTGTLYLSAKGGAVYSPTNAEANAMQAAANAQNNVPLTNDDGTPSYVDPNFVDEDGDGLDDVTGLPQATPAVTTAPATPTPNLPGGSSDAFSG